MGPPISNIFFLIFYPKANSPFTVPCYALMINGIRKKILNKNIFAYICHVVFTKKQNL